MQEQIENEAFSAKIPKQQVIGQERPKLNSTNSSNKKQRGERNGNTRNMQQAGVKKDTQPIEREKRPSARINNDHVVNPAIIEPSPYPNTYFARKLTISSKSSTRNRPRPPYFVERLPVTTEKWPAI